MVVYWLYTITGEPFLLELGELIHQQTFPLTDVFLNASPAPSPDLAHLYPYNTNNRYPYNQDLIKRLSVDQLQSFHCVNLAQGIKEPLVYYQAKPEERYWKAVKQALATTKRFHGQPQGMYGGDEPMHGNAPTQGIEFCSVVELMFSLETMLAISGDLDFADHLELIAFNALPTQSTPDFRRRQYFQAANQVLVNRARRNFYEDDGHGGTDLCFGVLTGYPCCTCNMHQGWPKLVQNLWYATADRGLAALVYAPCKVNFKAGNGVPVTIVEETIYPFEETVRFTITPQKPVQFPLRLRVPDWSTKVSVRINDREESVTPSNRLITLDRTWNPGDKVIVAFDTKVRMSRWVENSVSVSRGPLVYALKIEEDWREVPATDHFGAFSEVHPKTPWNYALTDAAVKKPSSQFQFERKPMPEYPWTLADAPLQLRTQGKRIPDWQLYNNQPGPMPHSKPWPFVSQEPASEIVLLPYGCTRLRITEFPVAK